LVTIYIWSTPLPRLLPQQSCIHKPAASFSKNAQLAKFRPQNDFLCRQDCSFDIVACTDPLALCHCCLLLRLLFDTFPWPLCSWSSEQAWEHADPGWLRNCAVNPPYSASTVMKIALSTHFHARACCLSDIAAIFLYLLFVVCYFDDAGRGTTPPASRPVCGDAFPKSWSGRSFTVCLTVPLLPFRFLLLFQPLRSNLLA
jgi:hypothetical protein